VRQSKYTVWILLFVVGGQFHQRSTSSFYSRKSRKSKKRLKTWMSFLPLSGSSRSNATRWTLMKLTPGLRYSPINKCKISLKANFLVKMCLKIQYSWSINWGTYLPRITMLKCIGLIIKMVDQNWINRMVTQFGSTFFFLALLNVYAFNNVSVELLRCNFQYVL